MHPWYQIEFVERKSLHAEMKKWLLENPEKRIHNGKIGDDGKVFCGYSVGYKNGEYWAKKETFEKRMTLCRENMRKTRKEPSYGSRHAEYCRLRYLNRLDVREQTATRVKKWSNENKPRLALKSSNRRTLKRNLLHAEHNILIEEEMRKTAEKLTKQTGIEHHVDHIIPIKHGGWHHHENLQILPAPVNQSKSSSPFWVSSEYKDFRSVPQSLWPEPLIDFYLAIQST
jgi:5-methylcytosine-specific restriction endonuclease McrA